MARHIRKFTKYCFSYAANRIPPALQTRVDADEDAFTSSVGKQIVGRLEAFGEIAAEKDWLDDDDDLIIEFDMDYRQLLPLGRKLAMQ